MQEVYHTLLCPRKARKDKRDYALCRSTNDFSPPYGCNQAFNKRDVMMKIEEAIVYVIARRNGGMTTDQIAEVINRERLHIRKDGGPVTSKQVYAVVCRFQGMFSKEGGRIMLMM